MKALFATLALLLVASVASAANLERSVPPRNWRRVSGKVDQSEVLRMTLALQRRNMDAMDKIFWEVSEPANAKYGEHLNHEQMRELISASPSGLKAVTQWLQANGISKYTVARHEDAIAFDATVGEVSKLLNVKFSVYEHAKSKKRVARALGQTGMPADVAAAIETIGGHRGFPLPNPMKPKKTESVKHPLGSQSTNVTPAKLYEVYNQSYFPATPSGQKNIQSFFQAQAQYVEPSDLKTFCDAFLPNLEDGDCKITKYIGPNQGSDPGIESSLDSEYITATGHGTETWTYSYANDDFCGDLMRWGMDVLNEKDGTFPYVISMSYGSQSLPNYCLGPDVERLSKDIQKMGAMGITVVIASGDSGSAEYSREGYNYGLVAPSMPASIPYCVAVGSTTFLSGNSGTEEATTNFGSGGGFSFDYAQPDYQKDAVKKFFAHDHKLPPHLSYNGSGRGTPDVSALGDNFYIISEGYWQQVSGTSCSTPSFAGMVTQLNNLRLANGKTLGFLNPLMYQNPGAFNDITHGNNDVQMDGYGWYTVEGWDPVTGLGTPNWGKLADVVKAINQRENERKH